MALTTGLRIGAYEIVSPLGVGGMGEVYRARDTKLDREVAIKVLPELFVSDPERIARFQREAKTLAALNHPHIGGIYGFEDAAGVHALVLELVDGPTLADRIAQGPIPLDEALPIARQIAEALEAAHEAGIIHRDLKPANIKLRPDGTVKVLDFGLAKALEPTSGVSSSVTASPTITTPAVMTGIGMILGTAAYMSPEQARGKPIDKRTDIWAFGAVLYEMLTSERVFGGDEVSDTLAFVITKEPDWTLLPAHTPAVLRKLLRRCLEKDRKRRLADIADARFELDEALRPDASHDQLTSASGAALRARGNRAVPWTVAAAAAVVAALSTLQWAPGWTTPPRTPVRVSADLGTRIATAGAGQSIELSHDGETLAFIGQAPNGPSELYVRRVDQLTAHRIEGTAGATTPFFSPDGQWVAYFADAKLKKVSVNGGVSVTLCEAQGPRGGSWGEDGNIVFMAQIIGRTALSRVSASGGKPEQLTTLANGDATHRWPQLLDGAKAVLFTASANTGGYEEARLVVQRLPNGPQKEILAGGYHGRYLASGHVVYMHAGTLFAMPFDLSRLEARGPSVPTVEAVLANPGTAAAQFTISRSGTLAYIEGAGQEGDAPIVWLDSAGKVAPLRKERANWGNIQFAPDGRRLAVDIRAPQGDIFVYEWDRDTLSQLTFDAANDTNPVWSPDGSFIAFASTRGAGGSANLYLQRSDGTGDAMRLIDAGSASRGLTDFVSASRFPTSWHPSGKFLAYSETRPTTGLDVMILPLERDSASGWKPGKPMTFLSGPANEFDALFSPDGRWIAYTSSESGRFELFVRPFPGPGGKWKVSADVGARFAAWSRSTPELLFMAPGGTRLMSAAYSVEGDSFHAEKPRVWAEGRFARPAAQRGFDIHPDGKRIATVAGPEPQAVTRQERAVFVFNFFDELRRIAPATKR